MLFSVKSSASQIAFKADDYGRGAEKNWVAFFELIEEFEAFVFVGVIVNDIKQSGVYSKALSDLTAKKNIHLFYHGSTHNCFKVNRIRYSEFKGATRKAQYDLLVSAHEMSKRLWGRGFVAFGAPCNLKDINTGYALARAGYKIWLYPSRSDKGFNGTKIQRTINVETAVGRPRFDSVYSISDGFHVIQLHPGYWKVHHFEEFKELLIYLYANGSLVNGSYAWY